MALIGANGAGKTTTLRAITGLARLRAGEVTWFGERIDSLPPAQIVDGAASPWCRRGGASIPT